MAGAAEAMVRLGKTEEVLERGTSIAANRAKLPRGNMIGGMKENHLRWWFETKSASIRRQRLHGWRLWQAHCVENAVEPEEMRRFANPGISGALHHGLVPEGNAILPGEGGVNSSERTVRGGGAIGANVTKGKHHGKAGGLGGGNRW
jgi:hypothetical protein